MNIDPHQARLISQVERGILQVAEAEERKLDEKLKSLENLGKICLFFLVCYEYCDLS